MSVHVRRRPAEVGAWERAELCHCAAATPDVTRKVHATCSTPVLGRFAHRTHHLLRNPRHFLESFGYLSASLLIARDPLTLEGESLKLIHHLVLERRDQEQGAPGCMSHRTVTSASCLRKSSFSERCVNLSPIRCHRFSYIGHVTSDDVMYEGLRDPGPRRRKVCRRAGVGKGGRV
ncbi:unnamed protein product [Leptosia nina]|uniref:Uncharacterized protein n=1 Tax=Leptosia nina TaxID=320188 RepID=A0AAV1IW63_9NEOP